VLGSHVLTFVVVALVLAKQDTPCEMYAALVQTWTCLIPAVVAHLNPPVQLTTPQTTLRRWNGERNQVRPPQDPATRGREASLVV
jgi:hypothetical protein